MQSELNNFNTDVQMHNILWHCKQTLADIMEDSQVKVDCEC